LRLALVTSQHRSLRQAAEALNMAVLQTFR
jgi:hypothetical protein